MPPGVQRRVGEYVSLLIHEARIEFDHEFFAVLISDLLTGR